MTKLNFKVNIVSQLVLIVNTENNFVPFEITNII